MCGIFGHFGNSFPDESILTDIATKADERGGHGFGMAFGKPNWLATMHQNYRLAQDPSILGRILALDNKPCVVFGHARLATSGEIDNRENDAQPLFLDMFHLVHNGNFPQYKESFAHYGHKPITSVDSEALLLEYVNGGMEFLKSFDLPHALAIYDEHKDAAVLSNNELPLYLRIVGESVYFCSKPFEGAEPLNGIRQWQGSGKNNTMG